MTVSDTTPTREELLDRYGRFYGQERFAVAFTATTKGDNAKRVTTKQWDRAKPLAGADLAAGLIGQRGKTRNVAIVLRPSNLVVLECDTEQDLLRIQALNLPVTLTVRSSKPYKRHFYFRPPADIEQLPYVAFRFESGKLTADTGRYFLAPPSIHPSGAIYSFLPGLGPDDVDIAELDAQLYRDLARQAREETSEQRERIHVDPDAKVIAGQRGDSVFRYSSMLRRWGLTRDQISRAAHEWNQTRCEPPIDDARVEMQVDGAMKMRGNQELERAHANPLPDPPNPEPQLDTETKPAGTWKRTDLSDPAYLIPADPPAVAGLLYAARRHVLSGPQESAKTLIAYHLLLQAQRDGSPVAIVDFEMGPVAARRLLHELGATPDEIAAIYYTEPEGPPDTHALAAIVQHGTRYALIDAAAGAFDTTGLDDNSRKDAETFARQWIRPLFKLNIATLLLDHVTKDREARGKYAIGSERKTGGADIHLGFDALKALSRGGQGLVKVTTHKDRPGFLTRPTAAMLELASAPDTHSITINHRDPNPTDEEGTFQPTTLMERISHYLERQPEPVSRTNIETNVKGKSAEWIRKALDALIHNGYATEEDGPRNARLVRTIRPFTATPSDPVSPRPDGVTPPRPTPSPPTGDGRRGDAVETDSPRPDELDVHDPAIQALLDDDDIPF